MHTLYTAETDLSTTEVRETELEVHVYPHRRIIAGEATPPARPWIAIIAAHWIAEHRREDGPTLVRLDLIDWANPLGQSTGLWSKGPTDLLDGVHEEVAEYGLDLELEFERWDRIEASDERFVAWSCGR